MHCKELNLRGSSFTSVETEHLSSLLLVDISGTDIVKADFRNCPHLLKVLAGDSQEVIVN